MFGSAPPDTSQSMVMVPASYDYARRNVEPATGVNATGGVDGLG